MSDRSDENLVIASSNGDKSAYAVLMNRHYKHVFLVCLGMLGNVHDAEDIAQEALVKGFTEIKKLHNPCRFEPWIVKIAKNLSLNLIRRNKHAQKLITDSSKLSQMRSPPNEDLHRAIEKLPQELRLPLIMYFFDSQNVKTVAQRLNISSSGVYQKIHTAIKQLHNLLNEQGDI